MSTYPYSYGWARSTRRLHYAMSQYDSHAICGAKLNGFVFYSLFPSTFCPGCVKRSKKEGD